MVRGLTNLAPRCEALLRVPRLLPAAVAHLAGSAHVSFAAVGFLRNLAIPPANKRPMVEADVVPGVLPLLARERDMVPMLQQGVVALLKHVCGTPQDPEVAMLVLRTSPLESLAALRARSDQAALRLEVARVYVALIRTLWSAAAHQNMEGVAAARARLATPAVIEALVDLVRFARKHPVLASEGFLTLTLVASASKSTGTPPFLPSRRCAASPGVRRPPAYRGA